ncbi:MAG: hypothetical protein Q7J72_04430 [Candidatus Omnitrophota bacterium]|nr:hypothetical protein [Candidatus Omnitrophota bacterium]
MHRFQKSEKYDGQTVARFGYIIPEYTTDLENKAPQDLALAKSRFSRRHDMVEIYYIRMGQIESYGRRYLTHFPRMMWSIFANTIKLPAHIISEYRYDTNEKYREKIDALDAKVKAKEDAKTNQIKEQLKEFIRQDLEKEEFALQNSLLETK